MGISGIAFSFFVAFSHLTIVFKNEIILFEVLPWAFFLMAVLSCIKIFKNIDIVDESKKKKVLIGNSCFCIVILLTSLILTPIIAGFYTMLVLLLELYYYLFKINPKYFGIEYLK